MKRLLSIAGLLALAAPVFAADSPKQVTFSKDVAPIFQKKCQECHQPGSIAPMSLLTYGDAVENAPQIREKVADRLMPPWHIDKTVGIQKFKNDRSLTDEQIQTIVNWIDDGTPLGDTADMPPATLFVRSSSSMGTSLFRHSRRAWANRSRSAALNGCSAPSSSTAHSSPTGITSPRKSVSR